MDGMYGITLLFYVLGEELVREPKSLSFVWYLRYVYIVLPYARSLTFVSLLGSPIEYLTKVPYFERSVSQASQRPARKALSRSWCCYCGSIPNCASSDA